MKETFTETVKRYRALFQQKLEWTPDEVAQTATAEGKGVVPVIGILATCLECRTEKRWGRHCMECMSRSMVNLPTRSLAKGKYDYWF